MSIVSIDNSLLLNARKLIPSLLIVAVSCFLAFLFAKSIQPVYQANAAIILMRPVLELPDFKPETMVNRWAWARDGMAIQEGLVNNELLTQFISELSEVKADFQIYQKKYPGISESLTTQSYAQLLRRSISINFAGAESQSFTFKVDHTNPKLALQLVDGVLQAAKDHHERTWLKPLELAIEAADRQLTIGGAFLDRNSIQRLRSQLQTQLLLQRSDENRQFRVVVTPNLGVGPIWPKPRLFIALGLLIGVALSIVVELVRRQSHQAG